MKKTVFLCFILLMSVFLSACANVAVSQTKAQAPVENQRMNSNEIVKSQTNEQRIMLTINNQQVIVRLYDNPASRDLLSLLPLTMTFKDYVSEEKIAYLPRKLTAQGSQGGSGPDDFAYFAPWGNLAIFYKGKHPEGNGLIILGTIESGKSVFARIAADFTATIEKIN